MDTLITVHQNDEPIYEIILSTSFDTLGEEVSKLNAAGRRICIVTDTNVAGLYLNEVKDCLSGYCREVTEFIFPAGEENKNLNVVRDLYETLILAHFDRNDMLVALGGGVVGDLCGYAAATYLRGVSFIQIPTTLLAQVDSSIGGKTGVDFDAYKNMVGAFHMPGLVFSNTRTLLTLSEEQFSSGMGEIIKHGLIKDKDYYMWLYDNREAIMSRDQDVLIEMIRVSDEIKRKVVEADPTEKGERGLLNFGHTFGHAIEKLKDFKMLHGECVSAGMVAAANISRMRGYISTSDIDLLTDILNYFNLPVSVSGLTADAVINATKNDKKMDGNTIKFILLKNIGEAYIDRTVTEDEMRAGLMTILS